ncbi:MAG: hypothetical protein R2711_10695 [Acidimicrobiales bacterium]
MSGSYVRGGRTARLRGRVRGHRRAAHRLRGAGHRRRRAGLRRPGVSILVSKLDVKADFGDASALFTSVLFVTYLAGLGLPVALARYAADRDVDSHVVFAWGVLATVPAAVVASAGYLWLVDPGAADVLWDWHPVGGFALFALIVMGSAFSLIVDVRAMTMRRWNLVLLRICLVAVAKIALLPLLRHSDHRALLIFLYLAGPVALSGFLGVALINRITGGRHQLRPRPATARAATRYSAINYLSTLAYQAPLLRPAGHRAQARRQHHQRQLLRGVGHRGHRLLRALGHRPGAARRGRQGRRPRPLADAPRTGPSQVGLMALGALATFLGKGLVVAVFDESYRDAAHILPAMMLAGIPWAVTSLLLTEVRVLHRHVATVVITVTLMLAIIVPALILVPGTQKGHGLDGASAAWVVGNVIAAAVAVVVAGISRRHSSGHEAEDELDPLAPME